MWWTNVVRIQGSTGLGTGVFLSPQRVLTAAHVVTLVDGSLDDAANISVSQMHEPLVTLKALALRVPPGWANNPAAADICVIEVPPLIGAGLGVVVDFGNGPEAHTVAVYGYPSPPPAAGSAGVYYHGQVQRTSVAFSSRDLRFDEGVSGAPLLIDEAGEVKVVGVAVAKASTPGEDVVVGLPLLQSTYGSISS